jgi:hypothetical protein
VSSDTGAAACNDDEVPVSAICVNAGSNQPPVAPIFGPDFPNGASCALRPPVNSTRIARIDLVCMRQ